MRGACAIALLCAVGGCAESGTGEPKPAPPAATWDGLTTVRHVERAAGLAFDVPATGYLVEARRHARALPAHKFRDSVILSGPHGVAVTVEAWDNPGGLELAAWFERHLAFSRVPPALTATGTATAARVPAILVQQPRSEQAAGRDLAVFAVGARVFRVTCHDRDDPRSRAVYERLLETFTAEAVR